MSLAADQAPASPDQVCPKLVGQAIPQLVLTGDDGASLDLTAAVQQKPAVLVFYRGGW